MPQAAVIAVASWVGTALTAVAGAGIGAAAANLVVGLGFAGGIGAGISAWGTALSIGSAVTSLTRKVPKPAQTGVQLEIKRDPNAPVPIVYGRTATGGTLIYEGVTGVKSANDNIRLSRVVGLAAGGPIAGVEEYHIGAYQLFFAAHPAVASLTHCVSTSAPAGSKMFLTNFKQAYRLGSTPEVADWATLTGTAMAEVTSSSRLSGVALAIQHLDYSQESFPGGYPSQQRFVIRGKACYDPRKDSTYPGGSGAHRLHIHSTYEWTENPYIIALDYIFGTFENGVRRFGMGASKAEVDIAAFVAGANVADANNWKCGGEISSQDDPYSVVTTILQAGSGLPSNRGAQFSCYVNTPKTSIYTIGIEDVTGPIELSATPAWRDRPNRVTPYYRNPSADWQINAGDTVTAQAYIEQDGGEEHTVEVQYPMVQDAAQAKQLATYDLTAAREFLEFTITCRPRLLTVRGGDCVTVNLPEIAASGIKCIVIARSFDPRTLQVILKLKSETDSKHAYALGQTATAPVMQSLQGSYDPSVPTRPVTGGWLATGTNVTNANGVTNPAILVSGSCEDTYASDIIAEVRKTGTTEWTVSKTVPSSTTLMTLTEVAPETQYDVAISYRSIYGVVSARIILGPVLTGEQLVGGVVDGGIDWLANTIANRPPSLTDQINGYLQAKWMIYNGTLVPAILDDYANTIAEHDAIIHDLQQNSGELVLEGYAKREELDALAYSTIENVLNDVAEEVETKRLTYLGGIEVGTVVVNEITRTDDAIETLDLIGVKNANATAVVFNLDKVQVGNGVSMANKFTAIEAATADATAVATQQFNAVANSVSAEANARIALASTVNTMNAVANQQFSTLANAAAASAQFDSLLGVTNPAGNAVILNTDKVYIDGTTSMADRNALVEARFGGTSSSFLLSAASTASTNANAAVSTLQQMGATIGNGSAFALDSTKVTVSGGGNLATRLTNLSSEIGSKTTTADVISTITAQTGTGSSLATSLTSVRTTANGASADATLALSTSNGNQASAVLTVGVGGKISGFKVNGGTGTFDIIASRFSIVDNSGATPVVPFVYSGGDIYMPSVIAGRLAANVITAAHIQTGSIVTDNLQDNSISTPVFTYSNSTYTGVGNGGLLSASITPVKRGIKIDFTGNFHFPSSRTTLELQLYCNGSPVYGAYARASFDGQDEVPMAITFYDQFATAGVSQNYTIQKTAGTGINWFSGSLYLQELKK